MKILTLLVVGTLAVGALVIAGGAVSPAVASMGSPLVHVELVSEVASVQPGAPFWIALRQRIPPGWHTYWVNPGDSGEPTAWPWFRASLRRSARASSSPRARSAIS